MQAVLVPLLPRLEPLGVDGSRTFQYHDLPV